jgi:hypothetical protein
MRILCAYFSRTGSTEKLAAALGDALAARGHSIDFEVIKPEIPYSWIRLVSFDIPRYPSILLSLTNSRWQRHHLKTYNQVEQDIQPMKYPDVSAFDRICIGGPKWAQISYPVARYMQTVRGIRGKQVGIFATFGGPPLKTFEVDFVEKPMRRLLERMGAEVIANLCVSSAYHEASIMPLFRLMSRIGFNRPIKDFMIGSEYANNGIQKFCDNLLE